MRLTRLLRLALLMITMAVGALAVASPAMAATTYPTTTTHSTTTGHTPSTVKIKGGTTSLTIAAGTAAVLTKNGVTVSAVRPAKAHSTTFSFPIKSGRVDPATAAGTIRHSGGLKFHAGHTTLVVKDFVIDTTKGVLTARVGGTKTRIPLLKLDTSKAKISADGSWLTVSGVGASLTPEAAAALNKTFGVSLFTAGLPIGTAKITARA